MARTTRQRFRRHLMRPFLPSDAQPNAHRGGGAGSALEWARMTEIEIVVSLAEQEQHAPGRGPQVLAADLPVIDVVPATLDLDLDPGSRLRRIRRAHTQDRARLHDLV